MTLRLDVFAAILAGIEHVASLLKVVLHHIDVVLIVLRVDSGVSNEQNAELVEALSHLLALNPDSLRQFFLICTVSRLQVYFQVNDRHVSEIVTHNRTV